MQPAQEVDVESLSKQIEALATLRSNLINDYKRLDLRRREIRKEIRDYTEKINTDRKALDEYYEKLSDFKMARRDILSKIRDMKTKSSEVEKELKQFQKKLPREGEALHERLKKVEWKLQTERLTRDEEKQLVGIVKELEKKLKVWKKADTTKKELGGVMGQIRIFKKQLDEMNTFKSTNDPAVKARHERVATMMNSRHLLFSEIEAIDAELVEIDSKIAKASQELDLLRSQRRNAVDNRRAREHESTRAKTRELVERAKDDAMKKFEQGGKLSFDELRLVYADDPDAIK